jgi:hypothetical protein
MTDGSVSPWYASGLAFECQRCGRCCAGPEEGYVWVTEADVGAIAAHLGVNAQHVMDSYVRTVWGRYSLRERPGGRDCLFLIADGANGARCAIYPVRPVQCRTWPFWACNLSDPESWLQAALRCRGINGGRLFTRQEVEACRDRTRV